jgi:hypothetical protein
VDVCRQFVNGGAGAPGFASILGTFRDQCGDVEGYFGRSLPKMWIAPWWAWREMFIIWRWRKIGQRVLYSDSPNSGLRVSRSGGTDVDVCGGVVVAMQEALRPIEPNFPTQNLRTMESMVDRAVSPRRFVVILLGGFAGFALALASLGIYALIS